MVEIPLTYHVFDKYSTRYETWYQRNRVTAENELRAVEKLGLKGLGLEIGVGTGWFAHRLGIEYGVDPSRNMLRYAKQRGIEAIEAIGEQLPLRSNRFDYILAVVTLCFAEDPQLLVLEARRVLRRGGIFASCIVPRDTTWGQHYTRLKRKGHPFYSVAQFYSLEEVYKMYQQAGYTGIKHIGVLFYSPYDPPVHEEPQWGRKGGFTCITGTKP